MVINIAVIALILGVGGLWLSRGFYSALINLIAVILAGAVAFALWEPLAYKILEGSGDRSAMQGAAWAIALAGPFVLAMGIFRLILDVTLRANVKVSQGANYAGGALCGAVAGLISAGIGVLSVGFLRLDTGLWPTDDTNMASGYLNVEQASSGGFTRSQSLWIPADKIVASMYSSLSTTTFRSGEDNLATLYPDLIYVPTTLRYNYGLGKGRNTTRPKDFEVLSRYIVGKDKKLTPAELLTDRWDANAQNVTLFDEVNGSTSVPPNSHIEGFVIKFNSSAKELGGDTKVAVGNGQLRLLAHNEQTGQTITLFPIAVAAQGEADKPAFQRFRYDAKEIFIASVGGASEAFFGFDFVVPPGFEPRHLYVKNIRVDVGALPKPVAFNTPTDRDAAVALGTFSGSAAEALDTTNVKVLRREANQSDFPIQTSSSPGQVLNKMVVRMTMDDSNQIVEGDQQFNAEELKSYSPEKTLRVDSFVKSADVQIVQVDVSITSAVTWVGHPAAQQDTRAPRLVDTNGVVYQPVGFIHSDASNGLTRIRYMPAQPINSLNDLPTLSRSKPQDKMKLIFRVSTGAKLRYFGVGTVMVAEMRPTFDL